MSLCDPPDSYNRFCRMGYKFEKIPASCFNFSEEKTHLIALSMGSTWNTTVGVLKSLCRGNDWTLFFKVDTTHYSSSCPILLYIPYSFSLFLVRSLDAYQVWNFQPEDLCCRVSYQVRTWLCCLLGPTVGPFKWTKTWDPP